MPWDIYFCIFRKQLGHRHAMYRIDKNNPNNCWSRFNYFQLFRKNYWGESIDLQRKYQLFVLLHFYLVRTYEKKMYDICSLYTLYIRLEYSKSMTLIETTFSSFYSSKSPKPPIIVDELLFRLGSSQIKKSYTKISRKMQTKQQKRFRFRIFLFVWPLSPSLDRMKKKIWKNWFTYQSTKLK